MSKALHISKATARVAPEQLKVQDILPDITTERSIVEWEKLKPYWESEKSGTSWRD